MELLKSKHINMKKSELKQLIKEELEKIKNPLKKYYSSFLDIYDLDRVKNPYELIKDIKYIDKGVSLQRSKIEQLPYGLTINGDLQLFNSKIKHLPQGLKILGDLDLSRAKNIKDIPNDITVTGTLYLTSENNNFNKKILKNKLINVNKIEIMPLSEYEMRYMDMSYDDSEEWLDNNQKNEKITNDTYVAFYDRDEYKELIITKNKNRIKNFSYIESIKSQKYNLIYWNDEGIDIFSFPSKELLISHLEDDLISYWEEHQPKNLKYYYNYDINKFYPKGIEEGYKQILLWIKGSEPDGDSSFGQVLFEDGKVIAKSKYASILN